MWEHMKIQGRDLKIAKILTAIFIITVIAEASLIYVYNPYEGVKCPNCNSTNTEYWMMMVRTLFISATTVVRISLKTVTLPCTMKK